MDTHDPDDPGPADDPWDEVAARWSRIVDGLREHYRGVADEDDPSEGDVGDALRTLGDAGRRMVDSLGNALRDPEVREHVRTAAASLVTALGATFSELGDELKRVSPDDSDDEATR